MPQLMTTQHFVKFTTSIQSGAGVMVERGMRIFDIMQIYSSAFPASDLFPVAATVNNELMALSDKLVVNGHIEPIYPNTVIGSQIYRRSLIFLFNLAWWKIEKEVGIKIEHSIGHAFYFQCINKDRQPIPATQAQYEAVDKEMQRLIAANLPIMSRKAMAHQQIVQICQKQHCPDAVELLQSRNETRILVSQCEDYYQLFQSPLAPITSQLTTFKIQLNDEHIVMLFPSHTSPNVIPEFHHNFHLQAIYDEYLKWSSVMQIGCVGQLNNINRSERFKSYVQICESKQNQKIADICKLIVNNVKSGNAGFVDINSAISDIEGHNQLKKGSIVVGKDSMASDEIKLVMISGPSSSGKTTTAMKLQYNLTVMGRTPLVISMDNYFVNRDQTPLGTDGKYDFEHVEAIDIPLFNKHLSDLLDGKVIQYPTFDFKTGMRKEQTTAVSMSYRGIVIIEGIHALNPVLTKSVPASQKFGIFIQPLPCLNMDDKTRISTRDYRCIRRIVRDMKTRGFPAERTLELYQNVRNGEERWIFPNQERADVYFNSALDYEIQVLATYVKPLLHEVPPSSRSYMEARRLLKMLEWIHGANSDFVPKHSLLREFIGGSAFNYD